MEEVLRMKFMKKIILFQLLLLIITGFNSCLLVTKNIVSIEKSSHNRADFRKTYKIGDFGPANSLEINGKRSIVFYVTENGKHGLEVSFLSLGRYKWSQVSNRLVNRNKPLSNKIGSGKTNTDLIIKQNRKGLYAAMACKAYRGGGKSDWYLPSKDELNEIYKNKKDTVAYNVIYWSSSEKNSKRAWYQAFQTGYQFAAEKNRKQDVVCIRNF